MIRFAATALAFSALLPGQTENAAVPDFDVRDAGGRAKAIAAASQKSPSARVEALISETSNFVAPGGRTVAYSRARFGLPRNVSAEGAPLSLPRVGPARDAALAFLRVNRDAFPFRAEEIDAMTVAQETEAGSLRVVRLQQTVGGLPVYRGRVNIAIDAQGRVVQVHTGDAAPGLTLGPDPKLTPMEAALAALRLLGAEEVDGLESAGSLPDGRLLFRLPSKPGSRPVAVDAVVFPMPSGEGRRAWRVFASDRRAGREMVLDAVDGSLLKSVDVARRLGSARVFTVSPLQPQEVVDFPTGWLPEAGGVTVGNNADAFVDLDLDGSPDPLNGEGLEDGRAAANDGGLFDFPVENGFDFTPFKLASAVTNAFYFANVAHDYFYGLGFQEAAGAAQAANGTRGGVAGDPVLLAVDPLFGGPSTLPTPDGISPEIRLTADLLPGAISHSAYDGDSVIHEYAHIVIDRLAGGPDDVTCIGNSVQESAIAEGISDYFAASFFGDPVLYEYIASLDTPLRLAVMNANPRTYDSLGDPYFQEHADGEIVAAILWDIRTALGPVTDKLVLDALKVLPCEPSFVDLRDALLTAAGPARRTALWRIFAPRGLGASARGADSDTGAYDTLFDAAFDLPEDLATGNNRPPRFLSTPGEFAVANEQFIYTARAEDPNGDPLTFRLLDGPPDAAFDTATGRLSYRGKFVSQRVVIEATDGKGGRTVHGLLIYGVAILTPGRPFAITGDKYSRGNGLILVDGAKEALQITTRGNIGDPNLSVRGPGRIYYGQRNGANETVTIPNPATFPFVWFVRVDGGEAYGNATLTANYITSRSAALGSTLGPLTGVGSSESFYKIAVPPGTPRLRITATGGSGDVDLALAPGRLPPCYVEPGFSGYCETSYVSARDGNLEVIEVMNPTAGDWFLNVNGFDAYSGVRVRISAEAGAVQLDAATHAASFGPEMARGGIGTLFGSGFTNQTLEAGTLPLPTTLGGVQVFVAGVPAPLFYVSPTQINFQLPFDAGFGNIDVVVVSGEGISQYFTATVRAQVPRLFAYTPGDGVASPVVTHADGSVVTPENPARPGEVLVGYLTGAAVTPQPPDGVAAGADPFSLTVDTPAITIGGAAATTLFSGATPGFVGLIQVNFQLPAQLPAGSRLTLVMGFGDSQTLPLSLPVAP